MRRQCSRLLSIFMICFVLSSCGRSEAARDREAREEALREEGYAQGFNEGSFDARMAAPLQIEELLQGELWDISNNIEETCGIHPEEAAIILNNYLDDPDAISDRDLYNAIWSLSRYYHLSNDAIFDISEYWLD